MEPITIVRLSEPNQYDQYPYGTQCNVNGEIYMQCSNDEDNPKWIHMGKQDDIQHISIK